GVTGPVSACAVVVPGQTLGHRPGAAKGVGVGVGTGYAQRPGGLSVRPRLRGHTCNASKLKHVGTPELRPNSPLMVVDRTEDSGSAGDRPTVDVAVGVLINGIGHVLLTSRPPGKVYAGYWEFPGGKLEQGESLEHALRRELQEEIGLNIDAVQPWRELLVDYPHALVRLHFFKVFSWTGDLDMREGQCFSWEPLPVLCS